MVKWCAVIEKMKGSKAEISFAQQLINFRFCYDREFRFHPKRKWRVDFIIYGRNITKPSSVSASESLLVEVEGLVWRGGYGRHQTAMGFTNDCEKYNEALLAGWKVIRVVPSMINNGTAISYVLRYFPEG